MEVPTRSWFLEQLAAKRQAYRRSQTVSSIPVGDNPDTKQRTINGSSNLQIRSKLSSDNISKTDEPGFPISSSSSSASSSINRSSETVDELKRTGLNRPLSPRGSQRSLLQGTSHMFSHKTPRQHPKKPLGRTPSSPSILLSRVREKIKEKVIETSVEWPSMAAMVQDRRQKAASAFEARLSQTHLEELDVEDTRKTKSVTKQFAKKVLGQSRSASGDIPHHNRQSTRAPLRRRSISIDGFDTLPGTKGTSEGDRFSGVVCTEDDLKSIISTFKKEAEGSSHPVGDTPNAQQIDGRIGDDVSEEPSHRSNTERGLSHRRNPSDSLCPSGPTEVPTKDRKQLPRSERSKVFRPHAVLCRSSSVNAYTWSGKANTTTPHPTKRCSSVRKCVSATGGGALTRGADLSSPTKHPNRIPIHQNSSERRCLSMELNSRGGRTPRSSNVFGRSESYSDTNLNLKCLSGDLFDPVIIGQAIEIHLETIMRTKGSGDHPDVTS